MKRPKPKQISVLMTLAEIKDFVISCKKKYEGLAGFNVLVSKMPGWSYIIAKDTDSLAPKNVLKINMDYIDPIQRPLIANAIHEALYRTSMTPSAMEDEMICKSEGTTK